jgi:hypothetical protein
VITVDGKGIAMRPDHLREPTRRAALRATRTFRTRLAGGEKSNRKRMATLACVYDADPARRRPHDIITPPGGRSGQRRPRPGPQARAKWLTASVEHDAGQVIAAAFDQADARDPQHRRPWIVLVDGACHQLDLIEQEAKRRQMPVHAIVDFVHVTEYLWAAARCLHTADDPAAEDWVAARAARILAGDPLGAAGDIRAQAGQHNLTADQRAAADRACQYLENKAGYLRYDQALANGWPIATGVIEGACRYLVADRLAITGSRWSVPGAEAVLRLRAVAANGDLDAYWQYHLAAEYQRVHGRTDHDSYQLIA